MTAIERANNLILLLVWTFDGSTNINRENFARAQLIVMLIAIGVSFILGFAIVMMSAMAFSNMTSY